MSRNLLPRTRPATAAASLTPSGRRWLTPRTLGVLAALSMLTAACQKPQPVMPPPEVTVAPAISREITDSDEFTGHFEAVDAVEIRPRVSGFVQRVAFVEGANVKKGDVLFTIDRRPYAADVDRAAAVLEQARTRKRLAEAEHERAEKLVSTQAISREELDARASGRAESDAAVKAAEAALETARLNLEWTTVRAPISGRVGRAEVTEGNLVQAGPPAATRLTTIVSLDPIYVYFDSDEQAYLKYVQNVGGAARGAKRPVHIGLANENGFPHEGTLDFVDNRLDPSAGTIRVRAVFPNKDKAFTPGLFARVRLDGGTKYKATLIQDQAIGTDQDRKFVLVLKPDSSVDYRPITLGRTVGNGLRVVQSGLQPGESVVINGLMRVRPGMKVAVKLGSMSADSTALARAP